MYVAKLWQLNRGIPSRSWRYLICIITRGLCSYNARLLNDDATAIEVYWRRREFPNYARLHRCRIRGKWPGCAGVVRPAPEGAGRMMQSKPEPSEGFDVIIRPAPSQPGHYCHYNTKLTNSRYFHGNSHRIALTELPSRPSCSWKSSEHCHALCTWINVIARIVLHEDHKLTCWIWCKCSIHVLVCVWSQMSCCNWLKLSLEFNFAVRHISGHTEPAMRSYNLTIYARYYHWRFCQQI